MKKDNINEVRKVFIDELKTYEGSPVLFDKISRDILDKIIFDYQENKGKQYKKGIRFCKQKREPSG